MATPVDPEQQRLMTKVALMYHNHGLKQTEIAKRFGISQPQVSRLLEMASAHRIVRTTVVVPDGLHAGLESELENAYGLDEAHVCEVSDPGDESSLLRDIGRALARQLPTMLANAHVVGFTSWSRSLREAVLEMKPLTDSSIEYVVEMLGDVGQPVIQHAAAQGTVQFAQLVEAEPKFLRVPGVTSSTAMRDSLLMYDAHAQEALSLLDRLDVALAGIAGCTVVPPLQPGDNFFTDEQFAYARSLGAVGQVNLRFIAADGSPVRSELDALVIGVTLEQLKATRRRIGVAGGASKYDAIRAAIRGGWINNLVTDVDTAKWLVDHRND